MGKNKRYIAPSEPTDISSPVLNAGLRTDYIKSEKPEFPVALVGTILDGFTDYADSESYNVVNHDTGEILDGNVTYTRAIEIRNAQKEIFGGSYDIVPSRTFHDGNLISGAISQKTAYARTHKGPLNHEIQAKIGPIPEPPVRDWKSAVRHEKVRRNFTVRVPAKETRIEGYISDPKILREKGYAVLDIVSWEIVFIGIKSNAISYIRQRNRERGNHFYNYRPIPIKRLRKYLAGFDGPLFTALYLGHPVITGTREEITQYFLKRHRGLDWKKNLKIVHFSGKWLTGYEKVVQLMKGE